MSAQAAPVFHVKHSLAETEAGEDLIENRVGIDAPGDSFQGPRRQAHIFAREFGVGGEPGEGPVQGLHRPGEGVSVPKARGAGKLRAR